MRSRSARFVALVFTIGLVVPLLASRADAAPSYRVGNVLDGFASEITGPTSMPPGSNVASCHPSAAHPYPVILVHGTLANEAFTWQALSPMLANAGYCVFAFNYGQNGSSLGHFFGLTDIAASAAQLQTFTDQVLAQTGAAKVDMVGHSQGGMMPRYYIKNLGGAAKVHHLVGMAPSNHGTSVLGFNTLLNHFTIGGVPATSLLGCVSCTQQIVPSPFITSLNAGTETPSGPLYTVIETKYDEVVTPYTSAFLTGSNVRNITVQNACGFDFTDHIGIVYDPVSLQYAMNALGANSSTFRPTCSLVLPVFSN